MNNEHIERKEKRCELKNKFIGFISLLGSGVVAAVGFMLIASQRWSLFDRHFAAFIILFVQWQTLGFAVSKIGIEHLIFAVVSNDEKKYFAAGKFIVKTVVPISAVFSLAVGIVFSPWAGFVALGSIVLDAYSLIIMADLNARGFYSVTSIANLINYPLFFIILFSLNYAGWLNTEVALAAFLISSLLRSLWLARKKYVPAHFEGFSSDVNLKMGVQQAFNFLMYRMDQILLSVMGLKAHFDENISMYIYMAKFPETLASVIVILGTVIFPKAYVQYPFTIRLIGSQFKRYKLFFIGYVPLFIVLIYAYMKFWNGKSSPYYLAVPFLLNSLLIIFANNITYSMLRQGYLQRLIVNMLVAVITGLLLALTIKDGINVYVLSWIVPIQMVTFLILSLSTKWGKSIELHA